MKSHARNQRKDTQESRQDLHPKTDSEDVWNVGYWTHPACQGQRYLRDELRKQNLI